MAIEIKVPSVGESINEVTLVKWLKTNGEWVERDEVIAELESEKATFEINAQQAGILTTMAKEGDTLKIGDVACTIDDTAARPEKAAEPKAEKKPEEKKEVDRTLYWRISQRRDNKAMRYGDWKYLKDEKGIEYLFDLSSDPLEKINLKEKHEKIFSDLKKKYQVWESKVLKPLPMLEK